uniref:Uncharacterized protein n=1 Tax=Arundo donax TaxID=35708 RepID=A0A0A9EDX7_ARUDO
MAPSAHPQGKSQHVSGLQDKHGKLLLLLAIVLVICVEIPTVGVPS